MPSKKAKASNRDANPTAKAGLKNIHSALLLSPLLVFDLCSPHLLASIGVSVGQMGLGAGVFDHNLLGPVIVRLAPAKASASAASAAHALGSVW